MLELPPPVHRNRLWLSSLELGKRPLSSLRVLCSLFTNGEGGAWPGCYKLFLLLL